MHQHTHFVQTTQHISVNGLGGHAVQIVRNTAQFTCFASGERLSQTNIEPCNEPRSPLLSSLLTFQNEAPRSRACADAQFINSAVPSSGPKNKIYSIDQQNVFEKKQLSNTTR